MGTSEYQVVGIIRWPLTNKLIMHFKLLIKASLTTLILASGLVLAVLLARAATADIYHRRAQGFVESQNHVAGILSLEKKAIYASPRWEDLALSAECYTGIAALEKNPASKLEDLSQARKSLEQAVLLNPWEGNLWHDLALADWRLSIFKGREHLIRDVEKNFEKALDLDPHNGKFQYALIDYYLLSGKISTSYSLVAELAATFPSSYRYLKTRPQWPLIKKEFLKGLAEAEKNILTAYSALETTADYYADQEDWPNAVKYAGLLLAFSGPDTPPNSYFRLGGYYLKERKFPEAREAFLNGLVKAEEPYDVIVGLAGRFHRENALPLFIDLAKEMAGKNQKIGFNLPEILGRAYYLAQDWDQAEKNLEKALKQNDSADIHALLARIGLNRKDWDMAERESRRAADLTPGNPEYQFILSQAQHQQGRSLDALLTLGLAINLSAAPKASYFNYQGWINWKLARYPQAINSWKKAGSLDPKNPAYIKQIGQAYEKMGETSSAANFFKAAQVLLIKVTDYKIVSKKIRNVL
ncbi:MAG: tetratricopeptide repeat protein [Pseudomonadota bacterium]